MELVSDLSADFVRTTKELERFEAELSAAVADGHLDPTGLVTPEGLGESATVGFLEVTFPNVLNLVPAFDDDIVGIFAVVNPTTGQRFNGTTLGLDPNGVVTSLWAGDTCARVFT